MAWEFSDGRPIFQQLVDIITLDIISGRYRPGDRIETVRELAVKAGVNPNTVQRAFAVVEENGLIHTRRGDGRYVGEDTALIETMRERYVSRQAAELVTSLRAVGISDGEISDAVNRALEKI